MLDRKNKEITNLQQKLGNFIQSTDDLRKENQELRRENKLLADKTDGKSPDKPMLAPSRPSKLSFLNFFRPQQTGG